MLKRGETRAGRKMIEQALVAANASGYILMERRESLATRTRAAP